MSLSIEQLLDLSHSALKADEVAINQLNDVFIDHGLTKIAVPNRRRKQNFYDSVNISSDLLHILNQEEYQAEFDEWLDAILVVMGNNGLDTLSGAFYINRDIEWLTNYELTLKVEREAWSISTAYRDEADIDALNGNMLRSTIHPSLTKYILNALTNKNYSYEELLFLIPFHPGFVNAQPKKQRQALNNALSKLTFDGAIIKEADQYIINDNPLWR